MQKLLSAILLVASTLTRTEVTGTVFLDTNGNGVRDTGEAGIANVAVSNQDVISVTDVKGEFRLPSTGTGVVFVSMPDGYASVGNFWRAASALPIDFPLRRIPNTTELTFVHASDTHIAPASL